MTRGKKVDIDEYITNIEPFLKLGLTLHEACVQADIPYSTVLDYQKNEERIRDKIARFQRYAEVVATQSVIKQMKDDGNLALKYLERVRKDKYSLRQEHDHSGDVKIEIVRFSDIKNEE